MIKPLSHLHITLTIPKILRIHFRRNRKLLKLLVQSAHYAIERYFTESLGIADGFSGDIYCIQSQSNLFNYRPHIHGLVLSGVMKEGIFYEQTSISTRVIGEIFRARLLTVLQEQGIITQELVDMLLNWNHRSGFGVHAKGRINGSDGNKIENVARACPVLDTGYMSREAISIERAEFNLRDNTIIVHERKDSSLYQSATYTLMKLNQQERSRVDGGLLCCSH